MSKEAMKLALRSIQELVLDESDDAPALQGARMRKQKAEKALREALAEQPVQQEPVAWWNDTGTHIDLNVSGRGTPLYTTPPQRKPLTDDEIWEAYMESPMELDCSTDELYAISRTVEAKLKEKNCA